MSFTILAQSVDELHVLVSAYEFEMQRACFS